MGSRLPTVAADSTDREIFTTSATAVSHTQLLTAELVKGMQYNPIVLEDSPRSSCPSDDLYKAHWKTLQ